jgi:hypothetical protein
MSAARLRAKIAARLTRTIAAAVVVVVVVAACVV